MRQTTQRGMTIWGVVFVMAVVLFFGLLFMKLFPPYYDNLRILRGMEQVVEENPGLANLTRREIVRRLNRVLLIDYVDEVVDMHEVLRTNKRDDGVDLEVRYEMVVPLAYNLSALIEFENVVFAPYNR